MRATSGGETRVAAKSMRMQPPISCGSLYGSTMRSRLTRQAWSFARVRAVFGWRDLRTVPVQTAERVSPVAQSTVRERSSGPLTASTIRHPLMWVLAINRGRPRKPGASASVNTGLVTIGGRYGIPSLEAGPYAVARADAGWVNSKLAPLGRRPWDRTRQYQRRDLQRFSPARAM